MPCHTVGAMLLVTGLTLVGEGLNDIINPLLRVKGFRGKVRGARASMRAAGGREELDDLAVVTEEHPA